MAAEKRLRIARVERKRPCRPNGAGPARVDQHGERANSDNDTPTHSFLDIIDDCENYVDFHTKVDMILHPKENPIAETSRKKCRFCS